MQKIAREKRYIYFETAAHCSPECKIYINSTVFELQIIGFLVGSLSKLMLFCSSDGENGIVLQPVYDNYVVCSMNRSKI